MGAGVVIRGRTASPYPDTVLWTKGVCMFEKLRRNSHERKAMATDERQDIAFLCSTVSETFQKS